MPTQSLVHVNNNIICAMDIETTGRDPERHEIIHIACVPLDNNLEIRRDLPIFEAKIAPKRLDTIELDALDVSKSRLQDIIDTGIDSMAASDLFESYFERLRLPKDKRIIPLGHNIAAFDLAFLRSWLGYTSFACCFNGLTRDTLQVANYINDVCDFHGNPTPFPKLRLADVAHVLNIDTSRFKAHDPVCDAYLAALVYKKLLFHEVIAIV